MYNLLIQSDPWEGGRESVSFERLFEYTDETLRKRFENGNSIRFNELTRLPCLFMEEGIRTGLARTGTIVRARRSGADLVIDYSFDPDVLPIPNKVVFANKGDFDIHRDFEFTRSHWAVKDVELFRTILRIGQPLRQQPKVFSIPESETIDRSLMSVMMPFGAEFSPVYDTLQEAAADSGLRCSRADEIWENPEVIQDIVTLIDRSFVVVCDCTGRNPNVFYEIGIAHSLGREVAMITQADADIPFDLRHLRYIKYLNNGEGREMLKAQLAERFNFLLENR